MTATMTATMTEAIFKIIGTVLIALIGTLTSLISGMLIVFGIYLLTLGHVAAIIAAIGILALGITFMLYFWHEIETDY